MNKQEAVAEVARLTKLIDSTLVELQSVADEYDIRLRLKALGDQWYVPKGTGDAERPPMDEYWDDVGTDWEETHPEWDGGYHGWQNSSTFC